MQETVIPAHLALLLMFPASLELEGSPWDSMICAVAALIRSFCAQADEMGEKSRNRTQQQELLSRFECSTIVRVDKSYFTDLETAREVLVLDISVRVKMVWSIITSDC